MFTHSNGNDLVSPYYSEVTAARAGLHIKESLRLGGGVAYKAIRQMVQADGESAEDLKLRQDENGWSVSGVSEKWKPVFDVAEVKWVG